MDLRIAQNRNSPLVCSRREPSKIAQGGAQRNPGMDAEIGSSAPEGRIERSRRESGSQTRGFTPPLQGGTLSAGRLPRISSWAIFVPSLREELHGLAMRSGPAAIRLLLLLAG